MTTERYGPVSFVVAMVNILVLEVFTIVYLPAILYLVVFSVPLWLLYVAICAVIAKGPGVIAQIGRGMFFGSLSLPLCVLVSIPAWQAIGSLVPN
ncbi:hypothetical protein [Mycobacterium asiaticum]|nr:hypothetical protein [Mycobacterium asiaticum]